MGLGDQGGVEQEAGRDGADIECSSDQNSSASIPQGTPVLDAVSRLLKDVDQTIMPARPLILEPLITVRIAEDEWLTWADTSRLPGEAQLKDGETYSVSYRRATLEEWSRLPVIDPDEFRDRIEKAKRRILNGE